ncbi:MAG: hypothetical protein AAGB26_03650 [Planctomycetota bacterium]
MAEQNQEEQNPLQGYFDWQVTTLMLAHDLSDPIASGSDEAHQQRRQQVEEEVRTLTLGVLPEQFKHDATLAWPPELMMAITRETLKYAARLAGLTTG